MISEVLNYFQLGRRSAWSIDRVKRRQSRLLKNLVAACFRDVPVYRDLWSAAGLRPDDVRDLDDLQKLPVISKQDIRRAGPGCIAGGMWPAKKFLSVATSGSTGIPLEIFYSVDEEMRRRARYEFAVRKVGGKMWHRRLRVGGLRPELAQAWRWLPSSLRPVVFASVDEAPAKASTYRPHMIRGLTSQVELLADRLEEGKQDWKAPRLVVTGGEMLTPFIKQRLERVLKAPVRTIYASWEFGAIAFGCPTSEAFHVVTDDLIVECMDENGPVSPGQAGEIVVTGLTSTLMPFIRYRLGDSVVMGEGTCGCQSVFPTITSLQGRLDDFLVGPGDRLLSPYSVVGPMYANPRIEQYRITQRSRDNVLVEYASDGELPDEDRKKILDVIHSVLPGTTVELKHCEGIDPDSSGKLRKVRSLVERF